MKEIGEVLKESREQNGVSIEEAAEDLNYKVSQLEAIESGNYKTFKDIFLLKCMITDYAKYLGLNSEQIIDEFNEYVFESTSKIPIGRMSLRALPCCRATLPPCYPSPTTKPPARRTVSICSR